MKIKLIKLLDKFLGNFITFFLPYKFSKAPTNEINKILIIRPGGIGDAVLLIPLILKLQAQFADTQIDILAEKRNSKVFGLIDVKGNIYNYDNIEDYKSFFKYKKYDLVIDTEQWHRLSSLFARYLGKYTIGFGTNLRKKNFDLKVDYFHSDYEVESFLNLGSKLFEQLGLNFDKNWQTPFINLPNSKFEDIDIVIFTGSSIIEKKWDLQKYVQLINKLPNKKITMVGGKEDIKFNNRITKQIKFPIKNYTGNTTLYETVQIVSKSKLLFSTDSGILHIGHALGLKTVSIFGPSNTIKWAPKGKKHRLINRKLKCSPCSKYGNIPKCKNNIECMKSIEVKEVFEAIISLLMLTH